MVMMMLVGTCQRRLRADRRQRPDGRYRADAFNIARRSNVFVGSMSCMIVLLSIDGLTAG